MLITEQIASLNEPELTPYKTLRRTTEHEHEGIFVAEGEKVVARLLESSLQVVSVLTTAEWFGKYQNRLESRSGTIKVFVGEKTLLSSIVGFHLHQGIMAVARIPETLNLDTIVSQSTRPKLFVAIDGITNSENLGVIVRNCVAFGVQALIVGETSSSPYLRRAVRNSMGTIFKLPVAPTVNLVDTINNLKSNFLIEVIAAHPSAEQRSLSSPSLRKDCCIVFGSEGFGISEKVLAACSEQVSIRMMSGVDSLNVASASAVFLYEVMRQRNGQ